MANKTGTDPITINQGAKPAQRDENTRAMTVVKSENTGKAHVTHDSENKRAKTV